MYASICCILLALVRVTSSANILVVNPSPSYSHQNAFSHLVKELSLRGHQVTLITMFPINDPKLKNVTEINIHFIRYELAKLINISSFAQSNDIWKDFVVFWDLYSTNSEKILSYKIIENLVNKEQHFDVVLVHVFYPEYLTLGKIYNCPTIIISSYYLEDYFQFSMGNPINPISHPNMMLPFLEADDFSKRIASVIHTIYRWYVIVHRVFPCRQKLIDKYFNISASVENLIGDVDLILISIHPVLQEVRSLGPAVITMGYHRPSVSSTPLKKDLKKFMDEAKDGFVYFSLGSNVNSKDLNKDTLRTLMQAISEIPLKFLYKYEGDHLENKPDNVQLIKWAPQNDILNHPNIKLFITQGGFQSMEEAIYSAVPMVVIPFFVDQYHNAKLIEKKGIGRMVSRTPLKREELVKTISEVLNDSSYKERVIRLRQLALDVPMTGLEKAIWWIEYVIRNKGAKHLRNPAADTPVYQYFLLDVVGFLLLIIFVITFVLYLLSKKLFAIITSKSMKYKKE